LIVCFDFDLEEEKGGELQQLGLPSLFLILPAPSAAPADREISIRTN